MLVSVYWLDAIILPGSRVTTKSFGVYGDVQDLATIRRGDDNVLALAIQKAASEKAQCFVEKRLL